MNLDLRKQPPSRGSLKRKSLTDKNQTMVTRKRKSILLQHSMSLNIPIDEMSDYSGLNCFLNLSDREFSLTYLTENDTLNPESLEILEDFKHGNWQAYLVGYLYNYSYQPIQRKSIERAITNGLRTRFQDFKSEITYHTRVSKCEALSPTENDGEALQITIRGKSETKEKVLYSAYLMSWCSTVKESRPFLPLLMCRGNALLREHVNSIVSEKLDVTISRLLLTEEELKYLTTYCLIMLDENDGFHTSFDYKLKTGDLIKLEMSVDCLLRLWKRIHQDDRINIDMEDVILYHEALDQFYEATFGVKLGSANFQQITVSKCFCLRANSTMWFKSTKVIHVVIKYLNQLAIKRFQVRTLNDHVDKGAVDPDFSVSHH